MTPALTLTQILAIRCPTCGAAPGEKCELTTGLPRFEPHQARRLDAADKVDGKSRYAGENERRFQKFMVRLQDAKNGNGKNGKNKGLKRPAST
jgi:hypothetical protein